MREIKFRAWDGKRMFEIQKMLWAMDGDLFAYESGSDKLQTMPVMQYTGLLDKNGVEIYEGDIVKILYTDWPSKPDSDHRTLEQYLDDRAVLGSVVFRAPRFVCDLKDNLDCSLIAGKHGWVEVIGNIHENPELIK